MKHFEKVQFVIILYDAEGDNLNCEHSNANLYESMVTAKLWILMDLKICKRRYPGDPFTHCTAYAEIHDALNRSLYYHKITLNKDESISITRHKEGTQ